MNKNQKKIVAGIGIYEILLITFVLILEPYGSRISSSEWSNFWTWFFVPPIATVLILFLITWGSGRNVNLSKLKINFKKFPPMNKLFINFFDGKLSLPISFWLFGFLGSIIFGFVGMLLLQNMGLTRLFALPWHIFICIGIWKSSENYKGPIIFSILAKVMIGIWSLNFIAGLLLALK